MTVPAEIDLFSAEFAANPHPVLGALRQESRMRRIELPSGQLAWLVTRYDDVRQALTDPRLSKGGLVPPTGDTGLLPDHIRAVTNHHVLTTDPPDHTRLRRLVAAAFTPRRVESLRPRVQQITDELLDGMAGRVEVDLVDALAFPLPIRVICELLGVPVADQAQFRAWSNIIVGGYANREQLPAATAGLIGYIQQLIASKRAQPADDLMSALVAVSDAGDRLSAGELSSTVFLLLIAGHETTVNLIANGTYLLLSHPEQWARLRSEPALLPSAIEEFLRYESPVQLATFRIATEPTRIGDQEIAAGEPMLISLLAANRDHARFPEAARFDITRHDNPHLAFGHGIHFCLGASLARLEGQVAFGSLLQRYPHMALTDDQLQWRLSALMHGLARLRVRLTTR
jgi:cytochrome P450